MHRLPAVLGAISKSILEFGSRESCFNQAFRAPSRCGVPLVLEDVVVTQKIKNELFLMITT